MAINEDIVRAKQELISNSNNVQKTEQLLDLIIEAQEEEVKNYQELIKDLEQKVEAYETPPLVYGMIIGPSPDDSGNFMIACKGERMEVKLDESSGLTTENLPQGREILLNDSYNIVKIRNTPYSRGDSAEVLDILNDGKNLHIKSGDEGIIVESSDDLQKACKEKKLSIGDKVRWDPRIGFAFEKISTSEVKDLLLEETPDVSYDDIGGLLDQVKTIQDSIELPYLYKNLFKEHDLSRPKGILLHGPPGCGKTMIAKAIANSLTARIKNHLELASKALTLYREIDPENESKSDEYRKKYKKFVNDLSNQNGKDTGADEEGQLNPPNIREKLKDFLITNEINPDDSKTELKRIDDMLKHGAKSYFMNIKGPELLNKYVGETESSIRKAFTEARKQASFHTPVVLFFDEMESMFRTRGTGKSSDMESTVVPQLLSELDGVESLGHVIIIGASNRHELIDPAILRPGRLDVKIKIDRPDEASAKMIFAKFLTTKIPLHRGELQKFDNNADETVEYLIDKAVELIFDDKSFFQVISVSTNKNNKLPDQPYYFRSFISGATIGSIVARAKRSAVKRAVTMSEAGTNIEKGIKWEEDLRSGIMDEFSENKENFIAQQMTEIKSHFDALGDMEIKIMTSDGERTYKPEKKHPYMAV